MWIALANIYQTYIKPMASKNWSCTFSWSYEPFGNYSVLKLFIHQIITQKDHVPIQKSMHRSNSKFDKCITLWTTNLQDALSLYFDNIDQKRQRIYTRYIYVYKTKFKVLIMQTYISDFLLNQNKTFFSSIQSKHINNIHIIIWNI